jgi:hypothetical protein
MPRAGSTFAEEAQPLPETSHVESKVEPDQLEDNDDLDIELDEPDTFGKDGSEVLPFSHTMLLAKVALEATSVFSSL